MVKIAILYTLKEEQSISYNPGDDIVRDGQRSLFQDLFGTGKVKFEIFKANRPDQWFQKLGKPAQWHPKKAWPLWAVISVRNCRILECDYIINAAGPRLFSTRRCHSAVEPWALVLNRVLKKGRVQLINLGFGTNFSGDWENRSGLVRKLDRIFCRSFCGKAVINLCRDPVANDLLCSLGIPSEVWPCPSLLARRYHKLIPKPQRKEYIALNFHPSGTRGLLDKEKCDEKWVRHVADVVAFLDQNKLPCKFIMHEQMELDLARKYFPFSVEERFILPESIPDYLEAYGRASVALTSRVHGAYAAASMGIPSVVIGSDSRSTMAELIQLPCLSCHTATGAQMFEVLTELQSRREVESMRLLTLCEEVYQGYLIRLRRVLDV
jgi:hypothetical protein